MELIDTKTNKIHSRDELKRRVAAAKKEELESEKPVFVSLGEVTPELCEEHGLAIVSAEPSPDLAEDEKFHYGAPVLRDGAYVRPAVVEKLTEAEKHEKLMEEPADLSGVQDPVIRALAKKVKLTKGDVAKEKEEPDGRVG